MTEPEFLEADVVLFMHDQALREYGGAQGPVKESLLQSALRGAINKWAGAEPGTVDLFAPAAAYASEMANNHAFTDANKRTAWSVCALFLKVNGLSVAAPAPEIIETVVALAARQLDEPAFAAWLRERAVAL